MREVFRARPDPGGLFAIHVVLEGQKASPEGNFGS